MNTSPAAVSESDQPALFSLPVRRPVTPTLTRDQLDQEHDVIVNSQPFTD